MGDIVVSNLVVENRLYFLFEKCRRLLLLSLAPQIHAAPRAALPCLDERLYALALPVPSVIPLPFTP